MTKHSYSLIPEFAITDKEKRKKEGKRRANRKFYESSKKAVAQCILRLPPQELMQFDVVCKKVQLSRSNYLALYLIPLGNLLNKHSDLIRTQCNTKCNYKR